MVIGKARIKDADSVAKNDTEYTSSLRANQSTGEVGILLVTTAGSITVTQQCSVDDIHWYDPVDNTGSAVGDVCTAQGVTTGLWISFAPVLSPYIRFKIVENNVAATTVTIDYFWQEKP